MALDFEIDVILKSWLLVIIYMSVKMDSHFKLVDFFFNNADGVFRETFQTKLKFEGIQISLMSYERATYEQ